MPQLDDPDGMKPSEEKMKKAPKQKLKEACNFTDKGVECPVHGTKRCPEVR
mgnify:FL=1|tara:strand:- start:405 stop:557 length:153 start_codon:yes stop_codon:yes gene_type:complete